MDDFKLIISLLLVMCLVGLWNTNSIREEILKNNISKFYKDKSQLIGFNVEENKKLLSVRDVIDGTPACKAGVSCDDVIVSVNKNKIHNIEHFKKLIKSINKDEKVILGIFRNEEKKMLYIVLKPKALKFENN